MTKAYALPLAACLLAPCLGPDAALAAGEPPPIPVGLEAYRQWERWPYQRIGVRAYMRSTYDRSGGNEGADASHFLYSNARKAHAIYGWDKSALPFRRQHIFLIARVDSVFISTRIVI